MGLFRVLLICCLGSTATAQEAPAQTYGIRALPVADPPLRHEPCCCPCHCPWACPACEAQGRQDSWPSSRGWHLAPHAPDNAARAAAMNDLLRWFDEAMSEMRKRQASFPEIEE